MARGQDTSRDPRRNLGSRTPTAAEARASAEQAHNKQLFGSDLMNSHSRAWAASFQALAAIDARQSSLNAMMMDTIPPERGASKMVDKGMRDWTGNTSPIASEVESSFDPSIMIDGNG
jgi:hypothetical protein